MRQVTNLLIFTSYGCLHNLISPCLVCTLHFRLVMARIYLQLTVWTAVLCSFYFRRPSRNRITLNIRNSASWLQHLLCVTCIANLKVVFYSSFKVMFLSTQQFIVWIADYMKSKPWIITQTVRSVLKCVNVEWSACSGMMVRPILPVSVLSIFILCAHTAVNLMCHVVKLFNNMIDRFW
jgi:hypothetical protein